MKQFFLISVILLFAFSCQKDDDFVTVIEPVSEMKPSTPEEINKARVRFAKALAKATKNRLFTEFLIAEARKEFMGDRDILYAKIKSEHLPGTTKKIFEILAETESEQINNRGETEVSSLSFYNSELIKLDPGINIYLYLPEKMENEGSVAVDKVAVVGEDFDEHTATVVPVYDSNENYIAFPTTIAYPDEPFFVVKENERVLPVFDSTGKTKYGNDAPVEGKNAEYNADGISYYDFGVVWTGKDMLSPPEGLTDNDGDGYYPDFPGFGFAYDPDDSDPCIPNANSSFCSTSGGTGPAATAPLEWCDFADRDTRDNREELVRVKFANNSAWNFAMGTAAWLDGQPELQVTSIIPENPGNPTALIITKNIRDRRRYFREDGEPEWYNYRERNGDFPLLFYRWDLEEMADRALYRWVEIDRTDLGFELTVSLPSFKFKNGSSGSLASIKIKYDPANEELGSDLVYYCDPANGLGTMYNTGYVHFNIKEEE